MPPSGYRQIVPGQRFLVKFGDDVGYVHERVALWPLVAAVEGAFAMSHVVITPHGDIYEEAAADYAGFRLLDNDATGYPPDFVGDELVVQFAEGVADADLLKEIRSARRSARATVGQRPRASPPTKWLSWDGTESELPRGGVVDALAGVLGAGTAIVRPVRDAVRDPPPAHRVVTKTGSGEFEWVVSEPGWSATVGTITKLPTGSLIADDRALAKLDDDFVPVARIPKGTAGDFLKEMAKQWSSLSPGAPAEPSVVDTPVGGGKDLRERLGLGGAEAAQDSPSVADDGEEARTLDVTWDDQGVRFKGWRDVCSQSRVHSFADFPLEGPVTLLDLGKHMQRFGGDPANWMLQFAREKHIAASDRTWHELRVLTSAVEAAGSYDQLNIGALASVEILCRRVQAIADAHAIPGKVDWSNGKFFTGTGDVGDAVTSSLRQWAARRAKDEADIESARDRARAM